ncbi:MAG: ATP-binding cassette domain-containing protein [Myxococcota bacterium]
MISVNGVTKQFQDILAVDGVSFEVKQGEIVGFLGPNAAGKTTTMRIITGFLPPTRGKVTIDGVDVSEEPLKTKQKVGYMPENPPVYPEMTVESYLKYAADLKGIIGPKRKKEIERVIELVSLESVRKRLIANISKGYKQRTGLAQALLGAPPVLILDEPTVGLDPAQIHEVRELIKSLAKEHTVILSTHILAEVEMTCQRVIVIDHGRVVADDSIDKIMTSASGASSLRVRVARANDISQALKQLNGVNSVTKDPQRENTFIVEGIITDELRENIARVTVEGKYGLLALSDVQRKLEDVFLKLTEDAGGAASVEKREASEGVEKSVEAIGKTETKEG